MLATHFLFAQVAPKSRCKRSHAFSARPRRRSSCVSCCRGACPQACTRASHGRPGRARPRPRVASAPSGSYGHRRRRGGRSPPSSSTSRSRLASSRRAGTRDLRAYCVLTGTPIAARIGSTLKASRASRCSGSPSPGRVELRREIDGGVLQGRVRAAQLEVLLPQPLQLLALLVSRSRRRPRSASAGSTQLRSDSLWIARSWGTCAIGRFDSSTSLTARSHS